MYFETIKKLIDTKNIFEEIHVLNILSEAKEFEKFRSKYEERKILNELNTKIKYPIKGAISNSAKKAYVLI